MWDEEDCVDPWAPPKAAYRTSRSVMSKKNKKKKGSRLYIPDKDPTSIGEPSLNTEMDASDGTMTFQPTKESTNELLSSLQTLVLHTLEQQNASSRPVTQSAADLHREDCNSTASTPTSASSAATTRTRCTRPSFAPVRPSSALRSEMTPRYEPPGPVEAQQDSMVAKRTPHFRNLRRPRSTSRSTIQHLSVSWCTTSTISTIRT